MKTIYFLIMHIIFEYSYFSKHVIGFFVRNQNDTATYIIELHVKHENFRYLIKYIYMYMYR